MSGVSGAGALGGANSYFEIAKRGVGYLEKAGFSVADKIGPVFNYMENPEGAVTGMAGDFCDALGASPATKAAVGGAVDIARTVADVFAGTYQMGADVKDAAQNGQEIADATNAANTLSTSTKDASDQILSALTSDVEGVQSKVNEETQELIITLQDESEVTIKLNDQNLQTAELIQANNKKIQENNAKIEEQQLEMQSLKQQIDAARQEAGLGEAQFEDATIKGNDGEGGESSGPTYKQISNAGLENNPKIAELTKKFNACAGVIAGYQSENSKLSADNITFTKNIKDNVAAAQEKQAEQVEVTEEKSASIDEAANSIVSMCDSAEGAINEMKNMLQGNFKKLDDVTLIKLATAMTKSAICGTNSGLLATAASAMGVGSLFTFGSTAADAAKLTAASVDQGAASAAHIAEKFTGEMLQKLSQNMMNDVFSTLGNITGVDINGLYSQMSQIIGENSAMLAEAKDAASQTDIETPEDLGIEDDKKEIPKAPENAAA